ncbi:MAG: hypothetical protein JW720_11655, partial [Sedimentisphaerales bacterium]|nr:hypothetical protein [Sedimentisphaerales bacterium]
LGSLVIAATGISIEDSLFEFASALGTVGLSVGVTGQKASPVVLWTEIMGMFLGRLEFFVIVSGVTKIFHDLYKLTLCRVTDYGK